MHNAEIFCIVDVGMFRYAPGIFIPNAHRLSYEAETILSPLMLHL